MARAKFERKRGVLIDRTRRGHATFLYPAPANATTDAVRAIKRGDYGTAVPLLSTADIARVRPVLLDAARVATHLEPNLAQALALIGGAEEVRILQAHLTPASGKAFGSLNEDEQLRLVFTAHSLLRIRPSVRAATVLVQAVNSGTAWTREVTARLVSEHVIAKTTVRVERILLPVLQTLLSAEDECFVSAFPALLQRHFGEAVERGKKLLNSGGPSIRRSLVLALLTCPYYGLPLLLDAFREEAEIDLRVMIARNVAPALPPHDLVALIRAALEATSPAIRLDAARLLRHLDPEVARGLARGGDPEPEVERELDAFRKRLP